MTHTFIMHTVLCLTKQQRKQKGTETKQNYAKKLTEYKKSELNEKNSLITEGMHVQTERQNNKCGCNTICSSEPAHQNQQTNKFSMHVWPLNCARV